MVKFLHLDMLYPSPYNETDCEVTVSFL